MDDTVVIIEIDGRQYYIPADQLQYIKYIDGKLVNVGQNTITMVNNFDTVTTYPRITCSSNQQCRYWAAGQTQVGVTSNYTLVSDFNVYTLGQNGLMSAILFILLVLLGVKLIWKR